MLKQIKENAYIIQAYIDFKKKFNVEEITFDQLTEKGFRITADDRTNYEFFKNARLKSIEIKKNFTEWYFYHCPPEIDCPGFRFILSSPDQKDFGLHLLENDIKINYFVEKHLSIITTNIIRAYNYQEIMEFLTSHFTKIKLLIHALYLAIIDLKKMKYKIEIIHLTYFKMIFTIGDNLTVSIVTNFSRSDFVKVIIQPAIGSLSDFIALKLQKVVATNDDIKQTRYQVGCIFLEVVESYETFKQIIDMQYTHDALRQGPNLDNVSFQFDFMQTSFPNYDDQFRQCRIESSKQEEPYKELVMIVNYRRNHLIGIRVNKLDKSVLFFDYSKFCLSFYESEVKMFISVIYADALCQAINDFIRGSFQNEKCIFSQRYSEYLIEGLFQYTLGFEHRHLLTDVTGMIFDYIGCFYLILKIKQNIHAFFQQKQAPQNNKLEITLNIMENLPMYRAKIMTVMIKNKFQLEFFTTETNIQISKAIENYFNYKLSRYFYNYRAIKGFISILLSKLFQFIYLYELMHFEIKLEDKNFLQVHANQEQLEELMARKKLDIEIMLEGVDAQKGKYFTIKFIDKKSRKFRIVRFQEKEENIYYPENQNAKLDTYESQIQSTKFLQRLLFLMTLELDELQ